jgi:hypothetical protein
VSCRASFPYAGCHLQPPRCQSAPLSTVCRAASGLHRAGARTASPSTLQDCVESSSTALWSTFHAIEPKPPCALNHQALVRATTPFTAPVASTPRWPPRHLLHVVVVVASPPGEPPSSPTHGPTSPRRYSPDPATAADQRLGSSPSPVLLRGCRPEPSRPSCWTRSKQQWVSTHVHSSISHLSQI